MTTTTAPGVRSRGPVMTGAIAGLGAGLVNLVVFWAGKAAGVPFQVQMGGDAQPVLVVMPLVASFVALLLGSLLLKVLARSSRGVTVWTAIAVVVFVAYTGFALTSATSVATGVSLTLMHVVVLAAAFLLVVPAARSSVQA